MISIRLFALLLFLICNSYALKETSSRSRNLTDEENEKKSTKGGTKGKKCEKGGIKSKHDQKADKDDNEILVDTNLDAKEPSKCSVCGEGKEVTAPDEQFIFPGQPVVSCGLLQIAGNSGYVPPEACEPLASSTEIEICQCKWIDESRITASDEETAVCLDIIFNMNCESPSIPDDSDSMIVEGMIRMELTIKSEDAITRMDSAIDEAVLAIGCGDPSSKRILQGGNEKVFEKDNGKIVSFNGLTVQGLTQKSANCAKSGTEGDCVILESPISIYYSGNATVDHLNSMVYSISDSLIANSNDGKYDEFASVYYVEAEVAEEHKEENSLETSITGGEPSKTSKAGLIAGIVVGICLLMGYYIYTCCRRRHRGKARVIPQLNEEKVESEKKVETEIATGGSSTRSVKSSSSVMSAPEQPICGIDCGFFSCGSSEKV